MKFRQSFLLFIPIILFFAIFRPAPKAQAQEVDYVANAIAALQTSNIYVHPGTPGTDFDTASQLSAYMSKDSQVVLVILPFDALTGTSIEILARDISTGLTNQKTIGLAIGPNLVGYSTIVPDVGSMMQRASSVSNSPVTALVAFSQSVQLWYDSNPQPTPTPTPEPTPTPRPTMEPIELPTVDDIPKPFRAVCLSVAMLVLVVILFNVKKASDALKQQEKKRERKEKHDTIEQTITTLSTKVEGIKDNKVRKDLVHACELAFGFLEILRHSDYLGYVEEKFPVLLANMNRQVGSFVRHEGGRRPLSPDLYERIRTILLNYDNLFKKMQDNDPSVEELLTSIIDSDTAMVSTIGYLEN